jgi:uncharacterized delta-60 repeat protein
MVRRLTSWLLPALSSGRARSGRFSRPGSQARPRVEDLEGRALLSSSTLLPAGSLDPGFGQNGVVVGSNLWSIQALATQKDGKIVAVGRAYQNPSGAWLVARYTPAGKFDPTFGQGGVVFSTFGGNESSSSSGVQAQSVAIQPHGKIVVGGNPSYSVPSAVVRYNCNGTLDKTFGTEGISYSLGSTQTSVDHLSIWRGKILAEGQSNVGNTLVTSVISELNAKGNLNTRFGNKGVVFNPLSQSSGTVFASMVVEPNGTIVMSGSESGFRQVTLAAISPQGKVTKVVNDNAVNGTGGKSEVLSMAIGPDGKIVLAGQIDTSLTQHQGFVERYNANLTIDRRFGSAGLVMTTIQGQPAVVHLVTVQPNGKTVVEGGDPAPGYWVRGCRCGGFIPMFFEDTSAMYMDTFDVLTLSRNGTPDSSFGSSGWAEVPMGPSYANPAINGLALEHLQHRIVVAGRANDNDTMVGLLGKAKPSSSTR